MDLMNATMDGRPIELPDTTKGIAPEPDPDKVSRWALDRPHGNPSAGVEPYHGEMPNAEVSWAHSLSYELAPSRAYRSMFSAL